MSTFLETSLSCLKLVPTIKISAKFSYAEILVELTPEPIANLPSGTIVLTF